MKLKRIDILVLACKHVLHSYKLAREREEPYCHEESDLLKDQYHQLIKMIIKSDPVVAKLMDDFARLNYHLG